MGLEPTPGVAAQPLAHAVLDLLEGLLYEVHGLRLARTHQDHQSSYGCHPNKNRQKQVLHVMFDVKIPPSNERLVQGTLSVRIVLMWYPNQYLYRISLVLKSISYRISECMISARRRGK